MLKRQRSNIIITNALKCHKNTAQLGKILKVFPFIYKAYKVQIGGSKIIGRA